MCWLAVSRFQDAWRFEWVVVTAISLMAAVTDVRDRRIPNALTFPLFVVGLIWSVSCGGLWGLGEAVAACILLAMPYVFLFVFAGGGAGDAKLMGAIGTWLGLKQGVIVLLCVAVAGGAMALAKAITQKRRKFVLTSVFLSFYTFVVCVAGGKRLKAASERIDETGPSGRLFLPYGIAIAAGVCAAAAIVTLWGTEWIRLW